jgi:hydroxymethylglutaryl-CoA lyase
MSNGLPSKVEIREVGPREGFQSFHAVVPTQQKLALIAALAQTGISEIEVTSFVRPDRVPQLADAESLVVALPKNSNVRFTGLYLNRAGFARSEATGVLKNRGWMYTSPSQSFLKANSNTSIAEALKGVAEWCALFKAHGKSVYGLMVSNAFGCAYEGAIAPHAVSDLVSQYCSELSRHGEKLAEICLADTVGMGTPSSVEAVLRALQPLGIPLSLHLHDTRGLGLVNAYVGLQHGLSIFESSIGGVGGCPFTPGAAGNIATEDLVYLCHSLGIHTGIDLELTCKAARVAESIWGAPLPGRVYKTFAMIAQGS